MKKPATTLRQKIDLSAITQDTLKELREIEALDASQSEKTKRFKRLSDKVKTKLYEDGRKSEWAKLSLTTYKRYLSTIRNAVKGELGTHHALKATIAKAGTLERVMRDYPEYSALLLPLRTEPAPTIGLLHKNILAQVLQGETSKRRNEAYAEIKGLKINHEFLYQLKMDEADKKQYSDLSDESLEDKKNNTITLNEQDIKAVISENLNAASYAKAAFALALASGRRAIEVLLTGAFEAVGDHTVRFNGQAKKQTGVEVEAYDIYTLIPASDFISALERFRALEPVQALQAFNALDRDERTKAVNARTARSLNDAAKELLQDKERSFKDARAIYTRLCLDLYQAKSGKDEDAFTKTLLGHADYDAQAHYKQFIIDYTNSTQRPLVEANEVASEPVAPIDAKTIKKKGRELDEVTAAIERYVNDTGRDGIRAYHAKVIEWAARNPDAKLTQTALNKGIGGNRQTVKRYLEEAAPLEIAAYNSARIG